jgi:hypothetical protein
MKNFVLLIMILLSVLSSNSYALSKGAGYSGNNTEMAKLVNYELDNGYMTIKVLTAGCTGINSFKIVAKGNELSVLRVKQDECGMKPRPMTLRYSVRHLGLDSSQTVNIINKQL